MDISWKKFHAMGTDITLAARLSNGQRHLLDDAENRIHSFEKQFSRFLDDSELSRLNAAPQGKIPVSSGMERILTVAQHYYKATGGIFDPTIIGSLEKIGYDKSFAKISRQSEGESIDTGEIQKSFGNRPKFSELVIEDQAVYKPAGLRIDAGGIGKGYIADEIGETVFSDVDDFWISAGGDLLIKGNSEDEAGWHVGVQNPHKPATQVFSIDTNGKMRGIATSGIFERKGKRGAYVWHHIIDPRTGLSVENEIAAVTAVAPTATEADIFAKTVLVLGREEGLHFIEQQPESACIIFLKEENVLFSKRTLQYFSLT